MKLSEIKNHWEEMGKSYSSNQQVTPTSRDPFLAELEKKNIIEYLKREAKVLEVGCGDAKHTLDYAKYVKHIIGVDVAKSLIEMGNKKIIGKKNIKLVEESILNLNKLNSERYDIIISQRCIINLNSWRAQKKALLNLHSKLKKGGLLLLTEGFNDGLQKLNSLRKIISLEAIKVVPYNKNMRVSFFENFISKYFNIIDKHNYGAYLFISRVYHPLIVAPKAPVHNSRYNQIAMEISKKMNDKIFEDYSYNLFYALKKK